MATLSKESTSSGPGFQKLLWRIRVYKACSTPEDTIQPQRLLLYPPIEPFTCGFQQIMRLMTIIGLSYITHMYTCNPCKYTKVERVLTSMILMVISKYKLPTATPPPLQNRNVRFLKANAKAKETTRPQTLAVFLFPLLAVWRGLLASQAACSKSGQNITECSFDGLSAPFRRMEHQLAHVRIT